MDSAESRSQGNLGKLSAEGLDTLHNLSEVAPAASFGTGPSSWTDFDWLRHNPVQLYQQLDTMQNVQQPTLGVDCSRLAEKVVACGTQQVEHDEKDGDAGTAESSSPVGILYAAGEPEASTLGNDHRHHDQVGELRCGPTPESESLALPSCAMVQHSACCRTEASAAQSVLTFPLEVTLHCSDDIVLDILDSIPDIADELANSTASADSLFGSDATNSMNESSSLVSLSLTASDVESAIHQPKDTPASAEKSASKKRKQLSDEDSDGDLSSLLGDSGMSSPPTKSRKVEDSHRTSTPKAGKPVDSYIAIIAKAILSAAENRMILQDIYQYTMDTYEYYNNDEVQWRNGIRHNLSINECFIKNGRANNGRGFFWAIHPACLDDFKKGDFNRRQARRRVQQNLKELQKVSLMQNLISNSNFVGYSQHYGQMVSPVSGYTPMSSTPISAPKPLMNSYWNSPYQPDQRCGRDAPTMTGMHAGFNICVPSFQKAATYSTYTTEANDMLANVGGCHQHEVHHNTLQKDHY